MSLFLAIVENIPYIISFFAAVSAVTETPKDDKNVAKAEKAYGVAYKVIDVLALNVLKAKNK
jgi:hypothetical protein